MDNSFLYLDKYNLLSNNEKNDVLNAISKHYGFEIKSFHTFYKWGISLYTAIFIHEESEFVFIPGRKNVYLGWSKNSCSLSSSELNFYRGPVNDILIKHAAEQTNMSAQDIINKKTQIKDNYKKPVTDIEKNHIYNFLESNTSYYRTANINPMLVERKSSPLSWVLVKTYSSKDIVETNRLFKLYREVIQSGKKYLIKESRTPAGKIKRIKYVLNNDSLDQYKETDINYEDILYNEIIKGFSVPLIDEWEYIAGGGINKTIFPYGNIPQPPDESYNCYGVYISDDIYKPEIVFGERNIYKGGDGGYNKNNISQFLTYLSLSPCYNSIYINRGTDSNSDGIYYRRIVRINLDIPYKKTIRRNTINKFIENNNKSEMYDSIIYSVNHIKNPELSYNSVIKLLQIYQDYGFWHRAIELVEKFNKEGIKDSTFLKLAGYSYFRLKNMEQAEFYLKKATNIRRNCAECWQMLAYIYKNSARKTEMEEAIHNLKKSAPNVSKDIISILLPKGIKTTDIDYEDMWDDLASEYYKLKKNPVMRHDAGEVVILNNSIRVIIENGLKAFITTTNDELYKILMKIFAKIKNSEYIHDEYYLKQQDTETALEYLNTCENIISECYAVKSNIDSLDTIQEMTNLFFDCSSGLQTLAYIHYSNSRIFEADKVFDTKYILCKELLKNNHNIDIEIVSQIEDILNEFINNITLNVWTIGEIQKMCDNVMEHIVRIRKKYGAKLKQKYLAIELSVSKDLKYILTWFDIKIDIKDAMRKIN